MTKQSARRSAKKNVEPPTHPITEKLEQLEPKLTSGDVVNFYCAPSAGKGRHGFGVIVNIEGGRRAVSIAGTSDTNKSTSPRAALAATLTVLEWLTKNAAEDVQAALYIDEDYVYEHLRDGIDGWLQERPKKRANQDLLRKLKEPLKRWPAVALLRADGAGVAHELGRDEAKSLAQQAREERLKRSERPGEIVDDGIWVAENIDELIARAVQRDRT